MPKLLSTATIVCAVLSLTLTTAGCSQPDYHNSRITRTAPGPIQRLSANQPNNNYTARSQTSTTQDISKLSEKTNLESETQDIVDFSRKSFPVVVKDLTIKSTNGKVPIRIIMPQNAARNLPVIFYTQDGSSVVGDTQARDRRISEMAVSSHSAVIFTNHSLSNESNYSAYLEEKTATMDWIKESGYQYGLDARKVTTAVILPPLRKIQD